MRVIITGGTGLIGRALADKMAGDGQQLIILTRTPERNISLPDGVSLEGWDGCTADGWGSLANGADAIINLAGEGIAEGRWSA